MRQYSATSNSTNSLNENTNQLASLNRSVRAANALIASSGRDNAAHFIWTNGFQGSVDEDVMNFGQQWNAG